MAIQESDNYFLDYVITNLGDAFAYAYSIGINLDTFMSYFISSGYASEIENGNPNVLYGQSGIELVINVLKKMDLAVMGSSQDEEIVSMEAFWCGYILMYYQHQTGLSFSYIHSQISMSDIMKMYYPLHEASEDKFVDALNNIIRRKKGTTRLQQKRKSLGLSQSQLAREANVNLRTLQEYEIGSKDINKASAEVVLRLAKTLNCRVDDLLELI